MTAQLGAHEKPFRLEEATIEELHAAIKAGQTTCVAIVQHYIGRVRAYNGVASVLVTQDGAPVPEATGAVRAQAPLRFPTATVKASHVLVEQLRNKGAIIFAKAVNTEYNGRAGDPGGRHAPEQVLPSTLGYQRSTWGGNPSNPYDTTRAASLGSSSGSAVSVSTNLVMASLGEETRASCRGPSNHNAVALILPHKSLLGFDGGAIGADIYADRSGIHCRMIGDCAKVLDALKDPVAGYYDPRDPFTTVTPQEITVYLAASHIAVMVTLHRNGRPHVTPNWYRYDGAVLTFVTRTDRLKYRNLQRDPRISVCIYDPPAASNYVVITGTATCNDQDIWDEARRIIARYTALDHVEGYVARWRTEPRVLITVTPEHIATRSGPTLRHDALRCPGP